MIDFGRAGLRILGMLLTLAGVLTLGCSVRRGSGCEGAEGCRCYGNGTCDPGLNCQNNQCVNPGGSGNTNLAEFDVDACLGCGETACASQYSACEAEAGCLDLVNCSLGCVGDVSCAQGCSGNYSANAGAASGSFTTCAISSCPEECTVQVTIDTGTTPEPGVTEPSMSEPSMSEPSMSEPSVPTLTPEFGANSLVLTDDLVPGTEPQNALWDINGVFYAYGDDCATISWDPKTRCLTGELCEATTDGSVWGAGIGMDFKNDGTAKYPWDSVAVGATGVAWSVSGASAGLFQVWITNMDPSFAGQCSVDDCAINGPPYGVAKPGSSDYATFSSLMQDDWGPDANYYGLDGQTLLALQFKVPAQTSATSVELCVESVGIYF